jgi:hypothetical protein
MSERDRRTLLIGAGLIVALLALFRGVPAWRGRYERERTAATRLSLRAAEAEAAVRGSASRGDSLDARRRRFVALAPAILDGRTPAAAGGTLAALVSGAAAKAGMQLNSVQVRPDSAGPGTFTRVAVRVDATGDVRGVARMLSLLERGPEMLAVREISVTGAQPGAPDAQPEALHLELSVEGLALSRPARASADNAGAGPGDPAAASPTASPVSPASPAGPRRQP